MRYSGEPSTTHKTSLRWWFDSPQLFGLSTKKLTLAPIAAICGPTKKCHQIWMSICFQFLFFYFIVLSLPHSGHQAIWSPHRCWWQRFPGDFEFWFQFGYMERRLLRAANSICFAWQMSSDKKKKRRKIRRMFPLRKFVISRAHPARRINSMPTAPCNICYGVRTAQLIRAGVYVAYT